MQTPAFSSLSQPQRISELRARLRDDEHISSNTLAVSSLLQEAQKDRQRCNQELSRLYSAIFSLENDRLDLDKLIGEYLSLLSPVRKLPDELLREIFGHLCYGATVTRRLPAHFRLSMVCARWRRIMLTSSTLWSDFTILCHPDFRLSVLDSFLERSGQSPLTFRVRLDTRLHGTHYTLEFLLPVFSRLAAHCARWLDITIALQKIDSVQAALGCVAGRLPVLRSLTFTPDIEIAATDLTMFSNAPQLRTARVFLQPLRMALPWEQLTKLTVDYRDMFALCDSSTTPNLEYLSLVDSQFTSTRDAAPQCVITSTLHSLFLQDIGVAALAWALPCCTLPKLQSLMMKGFEFHGQWPKKPLEDFLSRSNCSITTLTVDIWGMSSDNLVGFLRCTPSLNSLTLNLHESTSAADTFNALNYHGPLSLNSIFYPLVPTLQVLDVTLLTAGDFTANAYINMIKSRWRSKLMDPCQASVISLRSASLRLCEKSVGWDEFEPLRHLKRMGMHIVVVDSTGKTF